MMLSGPGPLSDLHTASILNSVGSVQATQPLAAWAPVATVLNFTCVGGRNVWTLTVTAANLAHKTQTPTHQQCCDMHAETIPRLGSEHGSNAIAT